MDIFGIVNMFGGLALFLFGMNAMGEGLAKASGGKLERILEKLTSNRFKAVLLGAGVTAVIQSSSATTVMVVGFVNSGIMKLSQAIGIIMGANIGTTFTSWILSLSGITSTNIFMMMLKPSSFSPIFALVGVILYQFTKKEKNKDIGSIMIGFAILMFGMETMSDAVKPLAEVEGFTNILTMFSNPILGILAGTVLTATIQSSSASVGILQALCVTGSISYATAVPIILGQNIGTCITAILSSIGAHKNAKRAAAVHLYFNIIGTTIFFIVFYTLNAIFKFHFISTPANAAGIAVVHTFFNVVATCCLFPFADLLEKIAIKTIPDRKVEIEEEAQKLHLLDVRFLETPGYAVEQCRQVTIQMAQISKDALFQSIQLLDGFNEEIADQILEFENVVDHYEDELGTYLLKLSSHKLSNAESRMISLLLHCIGNFERISDHAVNIMQAAKEMHDKGLVFSEDAKKELDVYTQAITDIVNTSIEVFIDDNVEKAKTVEPLEEVVDFLNVEIKKRHVKRLRKGLCTIEMGFILSDLTANYERISDHCSNIAIYTIQIKEDELDPHEYMEILKSGSNREFEHEYYELKKKYQLPVGI